VRRRSKSLEEDDLNLLTPLPKLLQLRLSEMIFQALDFQTFASSLNVNSVPAQRALCELTLNMATGT
jgi:hypothetical protein